MLLKNQSATSEWMEDPHVLTLPGCAQLCPLKDFKRILGKAQRQSMMDELVHVLSSRLSLFL